MLQADAEQPGGGWDWKQWKRSPIVASQVRRQLNGEEHYAERMGRPAAAAAARRRGGGGGQPSPPFAGHLFSPDGDDVGDGWATDRRRAAASRAVALLAAACALEALTAAMGAATASCGSPAPGSGGCAKTHIRAAGCAVSGLAAAVAAVLCFRSAAAPLSARRAGLTAEGAACAALALGAAVRTVGEVILLSDIWGLPVLPKLSGTYCGLQPMQVGSGKISAGCVWQPDGFSLFRAKEVAEVVSNALFAAGLIAAVALRHDRGLLRIVAAALAAAAAHGAVAEGALLQTRALGAMSAGHAAHGAHHLHHHLEPPGSGFLWKLRLGCWASWAEGALAAVVAAAVAAPILLPAAGCDAPPPSPYAAYRDGVAGGAHRRPPCSGAGAAAGVGVAASAAARAFGELSQLTPFALWSKLLGGGVPSIEEIVGRSTASLLLAAAALAIAYAVAAGGDAAEDDAYAGDASGAGSADGGADVRIDVAPGAVIPAPVGDWGRDWGTGDARTAPSHAP